MFKWLKSLFGKKEEAAETAYPFPTAKGQDQAAMAPYKIEPPVVEASGNETLGNNTASTAPKKPAPKKPAPKQVKKSPAPKKRPVSAGKPAGTRGRKPKAKTIN